jgi:hypothetical protein
MPAATCDGLPEASAHVTLLLSNARVQIRWPGMLELHLRIRKLVASPRLSRFP